MAKNEQAQKPDETAGAGQGAPPADAAGVAPGPAPAAADPAADNGPSLLDEKQKADTLRLARLAGVVDASLTDLAEQLETATTATLPSFLKKIARIRTKNAEVFHVAGPGRVMLDGERYDPLEKILLTKQEAAELGSSVAPGPAPAAAPAIGERLGGKYVVVGPGSVCMGGKFHPQGTRLQLSEDDARSLGEAVEPTEF